MFKPCQLQILIATPSHPLISSRSTSILLLRQGRCRQSATKRNAFARNGPWTSKIEGKNAIYLVPLFVYKLLTTFVQKEKGSLQERLCIKQILCKSSCVSKLVCVKGSVPKKARLCVKASACKCLCGKVSVQKRLYVQEFVCAQEAKASVCKSFCV